jgi:hypothetical protein
MSRFTLGKRAIAVFVVAFAALALGVSVVLRTAGRANRRCISRSSTAPAASARPR